jgi:hypothetical protein
LLELREGKIDWQTARLEIDTLKWQAGKEAPKRYGDRISQEISGPGGAPIDTKLEVVFVRAGDVPKIEEGK